jgi:hypothetical protein
MSLNFCNNNSLSAITALPASISGGGLNLISTQTASYAGSFDLAQGTGFQPITHFIGTDNDQSSAGTLHLFDPSNTTFVKHFIVDTTDYYYNDYNTNNFVAGYCNTTSAINAIQFKMLSGNIDSGVIKLYGVS